MRNQRYHMSDSKFSEHARNLYAKHLKQGMITAEDSKIIREFIGDLAGSISPVREYKLTDILILNREFFPEYATITTIDAQEGVRNLLTATKPDGTPRFKANTKSDRVRIMKRFLLWLCDNGYGDNLNEKKLHKIAVPSPDRMTKTAEDMLSKDEIEAMLQKAGNSRDRALISVLYEGGLRGRELADLTWNDIKFNPWNAVLNTAGKTGKPRYIPLVMSRPYLAQWKNDYPAELHPDSYVFVTLRTSSKKGEYLPMSYSGVSIRLKKIAKLAGITKEISTHSFRHSRVTHLITDKVPETFIKKMMWGNTTTNMFQTYSHLTNEDIDNCIAEMNGIRIQAEEEEEKKDKLLHPRQCHECGNVNAPTANFCNVCGSPLTSEAHTETETSQDELQTLLQDESVMFEVLQAIKRAKAARAAKAANPDA